MILLLIKPPGKTVSVVEEPEPEPKVVAVKEPEPESEPEEVEEYRDLSPEIHITFLTPASCKLISSDVVITRARSFEPLGKTVCSKAPFVFANKAIRLGRLDKRCDAEFEFHATQALMPGPRGRTTGFELVGGCKHNGKLYHRYIGVLR